MTLDRTNPEKPPTPEELLAHADGELPAAAAEAAEAWLRAHPAAADDNQALHRLTGLCRDHAAPEPTPAAWDRTLQAIESRLAAPKPLPGRAPTLRIVLSLVAAAAILLLLTRVFWPTPLLPPPELGTDDEEPYAVATADEIVIVSMDPRNLSNLVVGGPPVEGELDLAEFDEVKVLDRKPNNDGQVPEMHQGGNVPMILPTGAWGGKED